MHALRKQVKKSRVTRLWSEAEECNGEYFRVCLLGMVSSERCQDVLTGSEEACREEVTAPCIGQFLPLLTQFETF